MADGGSLLRRVGSGRQLSEMEGLEEGPPKWHRFDSRNIKTTSFWCWKKKKFNRIDRFVQWTGRTTSSVGSILVQPISGLIDLIGLKPWPANPIRFLKPCWKLQVFCHHFVRKLCFFQVVFGGAGEDSRVHENQGTEGSPYFLQCGSLTCKISQMEILEKHWLNMKKTWGTWRGCWFMKTWWNFKSIEVRCI